MTEPIYEYVKGEGWVINPVETFEVTFLHGRKARAEFRRPGPDEFGSWHHKDADRWFWIKWALDLDIGFLSLGKHFVTPKTDDVKWITFTLL